MFKKISDLTKAKVTYCLCTTNSCMTFQDNFCEWTLISSFIKLLLIYQVHNRSRFPSFMLLVGINSYAENRVTPPYPNYLFLLDPIKLLNWKGQLERTAKGHHFIRRGQSSFWPHKHRKHGWPPVFFCFWGGVTDYIYLEQHTWAAASGWIILTLTGTLVSCLLTSSTSDS